VPTETEVLEVSGRPQLPALTNLAALALAVSGITMALSAQGQSRWRVLGFSILVVLLMFIANVLGQLWDDIAFLRPFTVFYYYQPQKIMLRSEWSADLWSAASVPAVGMLLAVGAAGYGIALRLFTRRDLPAPL